MLIIKINKKINLQFNSIKFIKNQFLKLKIELRSQNYLILKNKINRKEFKKVLKKNQVQVNL